MLIRITLISAVVALSACATAPVDPKQREIALATTPTCVSDRECELKWSAARRWVLDNAAYKLKTITSDYLETYSAVGGSPLISARVTKEPISTGGYRIQADVWCDNMFGCVPDKWIAIGKFNQTVGIAGQ